MDLRWSSNVHFHVLVAGSRREVAAFWRTLAGMNEGGIVYKSGSWHVNGLKTFSIVLSLSFLGDRDISAKRRIWISFSVAVT